MTLSKMHSGRYSSSATTPQVAVFRINIAKSYALLEERVKTYNDAQTEKRNMVKAVHYSLAKKLIELYAGCFAAFQTRINYAYTTFTPLPLLAINNQSLSAWMICTDRTIRNYRSKLVDLGLISETVFHGSNKPYEIRLNPEFFWMAVNTTTTRVYLPEGRNFPLTCSSTNQQELTRTVSGKKPEPKMAVAELEPNAATVLELQEPMNRNESQEESTPVGATGDPTGTPPSCATPPAAAPAKREHRHAGRALLAYALPLLYPNKRYWTPKEKSDMEAQAARLFAGVTDLNINRVLENYALRILMSAHHYQRVAGVPIPSPWEFFNPDREHGFAATRNWPQYPEKFPVQRTRIAPKIRQKNQDLPERTGQIQIGQLLNFV